MTNSDKSVHVQVTVGPHGSVILDQLPYEPGQRVNVTISPIAAPHAEGTSRYLLSGMRAEYVGPFGSVAESFYDPPVIRFGRSTAGCPARS
jgi:hypothetical protein